MEQTTPPSLDPLDEVSSILDCANGACGVLAEALAGIETAGADVTRAAYVIGYLIEAARDRLSPLHSALLLHRSREA